MRLLPALLATAVLTAVAAVSAVPASAAAPVACPATFTVLHDDRIGALSVPAGPYTLTVLDASRLSCAEAADRFRQSLEDWDGNLPAPWRLDAATATFTAGPGVGFRIAKAATHSGGGGGQYPATGAHCPGVFSVLHNDRIGTFRIPKGDYTVTLLSIGRLSCAKASDRLAAFLQDFDGRLPGRWQLDAETATFSRGGSPNYGFRIKPAVNPQPGAGGGTVFPAGRRCPGTFRVLHDDHIGALELPAGRYRVTLRPSKRPKCARASRLLTRFLEDPSGSLPQPWRVRASTGTFLGGNGAGFRVKPVGAIA
ncbi:MAG TPA: hypothetical protein VHJ39_08630 [Solirubrobacteraceae bacterium]|jgi:hypothetical protein|nr:hypothetical protein [Solirubrobacteraceae bacterium]